MAFMNAKYNTPFSTTKRPSSAVWVILLLATFILTACGGGGETAESETEATTVAIPTMMEEPTLATDSLPATATPEAAAAVSPTAPATAVPGATEEAQPTATLEATYTPEPVDAGGGGATEGSTLVSGNCANPYFPLAEGLTYRYRTTDSFTGESEYTITYSEITDDSVVATYNFDQDEETSTFSQTFQCSEEGILSPGPLQFPEEMGMEMEFTVVEATGLTLPAASRLTPGETWTTRYVVLGVGESEGMSFQWEQTMEFENEVVAIEAVSVPAGDYPAAVRVDSTGAVSVVTTIGETETPLMSFDLEQSTWYVENIGMVRQESPDLFSDEGETSVVELVGVEN